MSAREWTRDLKHPYQESSKAQDTHGHLRPTPVKVPPFYDVRGAVRWMIVATQEEIATGCRTTAGGPGSALPHSLGVRPPAPGGAADNVLRRPHAE